MTTVLLDTMGSDEIRALDDNKRMKRALFALCEQTRDLLSAYRAPQRRRKAAT